jgi:mevalonate kinase
MEYRASAPGKVILTGEHAVVYGKLAIAGAINLRVYVTLRVVEEEVSPGIEVNYKGEISFLPAKDMNHIVTDNPLLALIAHLMGKFLRDAEFPSKKFAFEVSADLPVSSGLGSSAAFCVALSAVMYQTEGVTDLEKINALAFMGERFVQGNPSGVDNTVSTFGGLLKFQSGKFESLKISENLKVLIVQSKQPRQTKLQVQNVRNLYDTFRDLTEHILSAIDQVSHELLNSLEPLNIPNMQRLFSINQGLLYSLGVSTPTLDSIIQIGKKHGLAGKLTGGGGGGCLCFLINDEDYSGFKIDMEANGFEVLNTELSNEGVILG